MVPVPVWLVSRVEIWCRRFLYEAGQFNGACLSKIDELLRALAANPIVRRCCCILDFIGLTKKSSLLKQWDIRKSKNHAGSNSAGTKYPLNYFTFTQNEPAETILSKSPL